MAIQDTITTDLPEQETRALVAVVVDKLRLQPLPQDQARVRRAAIRTFEEAIDAPSSQRFPVIPSSRVETLRHEQLYDVERHPLEAEMEDTRMLSALSKGGVVVKERPGNIPSKKWYIGAEIDDSLLVQLDLQDINEGTCVGFATMAAFSAAWSREHSRAIAKLPGRLMGVITHLIDIGRNLPGIPINYKPGLQVSPQYMLDNILQEASGTIHEDFDMFMETMHPHMSPESRALTLIKWMHEGWIPSFTVHNLSYYGPQFEAGSYAFSNTMEHRVTAVGYRIYNNGLVDFKIFDPYVGIVWVPAENILLNGNERTLSTEKTLCVRARGKKKK